MANYAWELTESGEQMLISAIDEEICAEPRINAPPHEHFCHPMYDSLVWLGFACLMTQKEGGFKVEKATLDSVLAAEPAYDDVLRELAPKYLCGKYTFSGWR